MDRASPTLDNLHALELRVLAGPQQGARAPLPADQGCLLAVGDDNAGADIVLRGSDNGSARILITAELNHALVEVLAGEVRLGGQVHGAGARTAWAKHVPLAIGGSQVAFGLACEDEWPAATAFTHSVPLATTAPRTPLRRRPEVWLAATGAAVLMACAASLWMAHAWAMPAAPIAEARPFAEDLAASEFAMLEATRGPEGRLQLGGRLATAAQRTRLDAWLATRGVKPVLDVAVDETLVREVTEVFRVNGVAVQARAVGAGRVAAEAAERDPHRLARAEEVVRRDVRGLATLTVTNTAKPLPPPAMPLPDDPNKRIASLVPGEPGYVVTVDGARYFVGALLPSGHRITQVARQQVTVERDGQQSTLNF